jgi:hypothetical protein
MNNRDITDGFVNLIDYLNEDLFRCCTTLGVSLFVWIYILVLAVAGDVTL